ncbi:MAG TPA: MlaD family protein [Nocardioides sp.]|nr:MlaD family protein [Nocardioides sp.]
MTLFSSRRRLIVVALLAALGLIVAGKVTLGASGDPRADLYVYFTDASPLIAGNDVKSAGVKVGTITSIQVDHGRAKVGLVLDKSVLPIHSDATVRIRPIGLLGERYIDLDRGQATSPVLADGANLPIEQSSRATDLDQVLDMVNGPTGSGLSLLVTTLGEGVLGNGKNAQAAIRALAPALQNTDQLAALLRTQNGVLGRLVDSVTPVAQAVATGRGSKLDGLIDATDKTLGATARNDQNLGATLDRLPGTLRQARLTLAALSGAAGSTAPVLAALRPTTDNLVRLSRELSRFADSANPALDAVGPVLDQANVLLARARPVARSLSSLSADMRTTGAKVRRIGTAGLDNLGTVLDFVRNWALTTNGQDGLSHYFRAHLVVTTDILTGYTGGKVPAPQSGTASGGGDGGLTAPLQGLLGGLTSPLGSLLGGTQSHAASGGSATGLNHSQENSLLSTLLGGL